MSSEPVVVRLRDPGQTGELGRLLGTHLRPGQGLALVGELGSGKTCLARGVARGLQVDDPGGVCSPTYLLVVEHPGTVPMLHLDAYLEAKSRAFLMDGGLDYLSEFQGVVVVEWADRLADLLPEETLWVELRIASGPSEPSREAIMGGRDRGPFPWLEEVAKSLNHGEGSPVDPEG